jgi:hypothetical protein
MLMSAGEMRSILDASTQLENRVADMRLVFGEDSRKGIWSEVSGWRKCRQPLKVSGWRWHICQPV